MKWKTRSFVCLVGWFVVVVVVCLFLGFLVSLFVLCVCVFVFFFFFFFFFWFFFFFLFQLHERVRYLIVPQNVAHKVCLAVMQRISLVPIEPLQGGRQTKTRKKSL